MIENKVNLIIFDVEINVKNGRKVMVLGIIYCPLLITEGFTVNIYSYVI